MDIDAHWRDSELLAVKLIQSITKISTAKWLVVSHQSESLIFPASFAFLKIVALPIILPTRFTSLADTGPEPLLF